jgi:hypothetical protein
MCVALRTSVAAPCGGGPMTVAGASGTSWLVARDVEPGFLEPDEYDADFVAAPSTAKAVYAFSLSADI